MKCEKNMVKKILKIHNLLKLLQFLIQKLENFIEIQGT